MFPDDQDDKVFLRTAMLSSRSKIFLVLKKNSRVSCSYVSIVHINSHKKAIGFAITCYTGAV